MVFVVRAQITNILPTNEVTLPTFTCSASSNHENIIHEVTEYCSTTNVLSPENYRLYGITPTGIRGVSAKRSSSQIATISYLL